MKMNGIKVGYVLGIIFFVAMAQCGRGQTWSTNAGSPSAFMLAASADGEKLVAACGDGDVNTSTNHGVSWTYRSGLPNSTVVASSADGSVLYCRAGSLDFSTNSGVSWHPTGTVPTYSSGTGEQFITCSADGSKVFLALGSGQYAANGLTSPLYTSTNFGATWVTNSTLILRWQCAAMSADGSRMTVAVSGGAIYTSTNFGSTWVSNAVPNKNWTGMASSVDGNRMIAVAGIGASPASAGVYTMTNFNGIWVSNALPSLNWAAVTMSASGDRVLAVTGGYSGTGLIYSSTNGGATFNTNTAPLKGWAAVAMSADGRKLFAGDYDGKGVYTTTLPVPSPVLQMVNTNGALSVSWPVAGTNVVLQECSDLVSWQNSIRVPKLNFTNLNDEVSIVPSNGSAFFRLQSQ
jgi:hypothetical protein